MKNAIVFFCVFLSVCICSRAVAQIRESKHELRFQISDGIPLAVVNGITMALTDAFSSSFNDYKIKRTGESTMPLVYGLGYRYHVSPRVNVGLDLGYMQFDADYELKKDNDRQSGTRKTNFVLILPTAEYAYMNKRKVQLYGNASVGLATLSGKSSVGASANNDKDYSSTVFAFQVNPIGVRYGERFGGFAELGFGFKGFLSLGFSARL